MKIEIIDTIANKVLDVDYFSGRDSVKTISKLKLSFINDNVELNTHILFECIRPYISSSKNKIPYIRFDYERVYFCRPIESDKNSILLYKYDLIDRASEIFKQLSNFCLFKNIIYPCSKNIYIKELFEKEGFDILDD